MNVGLPGGGDPVTSSDTMFWVLIAAMVGLMGGMLYWFRRRGWF